MWLTAVVLLTGCAMRVTRWAESAADEDMTDNVARGAEGRK